MAHLLEEGLAEERLAAMIAEAQRLESAAESLADRLAQKGQCSEAVLEVAKHLDDVPHRTTTDRGDWLETLVHLIMLCVVGAMIANPVLIFVVPYGMAMSALVVPCAVLVARSLSNGSRQIDANAFAAIFTLISAVVSVLAGWNMASKGMPMFMATPHDSWGIMVGDLAVESAPYVSGIISGGLLVFGLLRVGGLVAIDSPKVARALAGFDEGHCETTIVAGSALLSTCITVVVLVYWASTAIQNPSKPFTFPFTSVFTSTPATSDG